MCTRLVLMRRSRRAHLYFLMTLVHRERHQLSAKHFRRCERSRRRSCLESSEPQFPYVLQKISALQPRRVAFQRFNNNEFPTTETELIAIAAPASAGFNMPAAARGMPSTL